MEQAIQKWLILAHCFNMDGRAASQTITDKLPFLMEKGIEPVVVSAPTGKKDTAFAHHQVLSPAPSGINFELRKIIEQDFRDSLWGKVLKALVTLFCLPFLIFEKIFVNLDSHWSWFLTACVKSVWLYKQHRFKMIYTTAGPSSTHLAGYILKRILGLPWLAEIHDPLISETGKRRYQRYAFHKWLEKIIFRHADGIIYFTETACENARKRTGIRHNSHVLRPGANPPRLEGVAYTQTEKLHFGHFGSLATDRSLYPFLAGLGALLEKEPRLRDKIVVDIYGAPLDSASKNGLAQFSLEGIVREHGRLEYDPVTGKSGREQVFEKMHLSDVLILIHGKAGISEEYIPSKLYEYLLTQRPIAGIASIHSELGGMLSAFGHRLADPSDQKRIRFLIQEYVNEWENNLLGSPKKSSVFTVKENVNNLIDITESFF